MRTLVDQTFAEAQRWFEALTQLDPNGRLPRRDDVVMLRGGDLPDVEMRDWRLNPERPALIVGTQDMLVSRALMRGYGMRRTSWPIDFALLNNDAQWIFDEVQLMGAALPTSAQLDAFRREAGCTSRSLWMSATLDPAWLATVDRPGPFTVWRVPNDFPADHNDPRIARLTGAPKPLTRAAVALTEPKRLAAYAVALAGDVLNALPGNGFALVVVNTVARAQALFRALLAAGVSQDDAVLIHSRFRARDREHHMRRLIEGRPRVVVATQAIEAGVDISAAALWTELAPWDALVQRFGRVNRRGEVVGGSRVCWIDLGPDDALAAPYEPAALAAAREKLTALDDVRSDALTGVGEKPAGLRVIRRKDFIDLFDTDPDLTGFDVDIAPYVRDTEDTDAQVCWRDLTSGPAGQPEPRSDELCAVPIGRGAHWIKKVRGRHDVFRADPQADDGWSRLTDAPWPGMTLMVDAAAGGYSSTLGFDPSSTEPVSVLGGGGAPPETLDADPRSAIGKALTIAEHTGHVVAELEALLAVVGVGEAAASVREAARWHDAGKAHPVFQATMEKGINPDRTRPSGLLAKTHRQARHDRPGFRHEVASLLAFLASRGWSREADLAAYLIAAHHGKVRLSLRAWPSERARLPDGKAPCRFARGVWEGDQLPAVDLGGGVDAAPTGLTLSIMELGRDPTTGASWTERTRALLAEHGPFRLAFLEALLVAADRRASARERGE